MFRVHSEHKNVFHIGSGWPHASQVCCYTPFFGGEDIPMLSFLFCRRGDGSVEDGLEMKYTGLGSFES